MNMQFLQNVKWLLKKRNLILSDISLQALHCLKEKENQWKNFPPFHIKERVKNSWRSVSLGVFPRTRGSGPLCWVMSQRRTVHLHGFVWYLLNRKPESSSHGFCSLEAREHWLPPSACVSSASWYNHNNGGKDYHLLCTLYALTPHQSCTVRSSIIPFQTKKHKAQRSILPHTPGMMVNFMGQLG